ncbi:hypothetical protein REC12_03005 [Desulfosporosinus sp. PR]|uniref:hypothetical protein n=1 Tax=Candidatus Desulfosporosinus nitrosoreducens TaxID=3401928 RepID=UPI0027FAB4A3|nr:hypothetical protein [Desulfosporosinus sp. PR]MDQ7092555.1 hypothetical protein [Desulfosporosinus sp. PR]
MITENQESLNKRINEAIDRLSALRDLKQAVLDLEACGPIAVEPLRKFLFTRDRSGIFEPRCRAVEVLAALGAKEVLMDFLARFRPKLVPGSEIGNLKSEVEIEEEPSFGKEHLYSNFDIPDPVEQAGDEAVANAVARALMKWPDDDVFTLLLETTKRKLLAGVVEALGEYRRPEVIPVFASALGDDFYRPAAENAFRKLGVQACPCLLQLAATKTPTPEAESESSRRWRRSALRLFAELHQGEDLPASVCSLMTDADPQIALLACSLLLPRVSGTEREKVAARLVDLLDNTDWLFRAEVEELLIRYSIIQ